MYCRWCFFKLNVKKFIGILPAIVLETFLFGLVLLGIGACAAKAVYGEKAVKEIRVGVVAAGEDSTADMLVRFVGSMDSIKDTVSFSLLSEEEARRKLDEGEIYAAVLLPEGLIDSILSGENIPASILLDASHSEMETMVFAELSNAGARLLTTAQAGIYAADAFWEEQGRRDKISEAEEYLNAAYLSYALNRISLLKEIEVEAVKGVNLTDYYAVALLLAFLSFAGLSFGRYMQVERGEREMLIESRGIRPGERYLIETAAFSGIFAVLCTCFTVPVGVLFAKAPGSSFRPGACWLFLPVIWFVVGAFIRLLFQLVGNHTGGIGICFVVLMAMMAAAGVFIPSAFLPLWVEKAGTYVPYKLWMESLTAILQRRFWRSVGGMAVGLLVMPVVSLTVGAAAAVLQSKKHLRWAGLSPLRN